MPTNKSIKTAAQNQFRARNIVIIHIEVEYGYQYNALLYTYIRFDGFQGESFNYYVSAKKWNWILINFLWGGGVVFVGHYSAANTPFLHRIRMALRLIHVLDCNIHCALLVSLHIKPIVPVAESVLNYNPFNSILNEFSVNKQSKLTVNGRLFVVTLFYFLYCVCEWTV